MLSLQAAARAVTLLLLGTLTLSGPAHGQRADDGRAAPSPTGAVLFRVVNESSASVSRAEIVLPILGLTLSTSERGEVLLTGVRAGVYMVQARALGHRPEWLSLRVQDDTIAAVFTLGSAMATLDTVHARETSAGAAGLAGFEHRRRTAPEGRFLSREYIAARRGRADLASLLRDVAGVSVVRTPAGTVVRARRSSALSACAGGMLLYVDGVLMSAGARTIGARAPSESSTWKEKLPNPPPPSASYPVDTAKAARPMGQTGRIFTEPTWGGPGNFSSGGGAAAVSFDVTTVPIAIVTGVEVYTGASIPPQLMAPGAAECGVLAIWTA